MKFQKQISIIQKKKNVQIGNSFQTMFLTKTNLESPPEY